MHSVLLGCWPQLNMLSSNQFSIFIRCIPPEVPNQSVTPCMVCSVLEPRWDSAILHLLSFSFIIAATPTFLLCDGWAIYIWSWPSLISDACWSSRANTSLSGMCIMKPFVCQWQVYMGLFWCTQSHWGQLHICSLACGGASIVSSIPLLGLGVSCYLSTFHLILTFSPSPSQLLPSLSHELSMHQSEKRAAWGRGRGRKWGVVMNVTCHNVAMERSGRSWSHER